MLLLQFTMYQLRKAVSKSGQLGRGVNPKKFGVLPAKRAADLGRELPLVYFATDDTTSYFFFCARPHSLLSPHSCSF